MKKILLLAIIISLSFGCENKQRPLSQNDSNFTRPPRPADVPVFDCNGDTIEWGWKQQLAYKENRIFFHYDSVKQCVYLIVLKK